jgi:hypothetical protein
VPEALHQPFVSVSKTEDLANTVVVVEAQGHRADHVVDPRAEAAAGDDAAGDGGRVEKDPLSRTGQFHGWHGSPGPDQLPDLGGVRVEEDPIVIAGIAYPLHGRWEMAFPQTFDGKIEFLFSHHRSLVSCAAIS